MCLRRSGGAVDILRLMAAAEIDAKGEIARLRTGAGQKQIAEAGQARHGFSLRAISFAEADQFGETARGQCGQGAGAETAAGNDAGGDGEHILCRAADFNTAQVARMIGPKRRRPDRPRQRAGKRPVGRRQRHRRRHAARHVGGEARPR